MNKICSDQTQALTFYYLKLDYFQNRMEIIESVQPFKVRPFQNIYLDVNIITLISTFVSNQMQSSRVRQTN